MAKVKMILWALVGILMLGWVFFMPIGWWRYPPHFWDNLRSFVAFGIGVFIANKIGRKKV